MFYLLKRVKLSFLYLTIKIIKFKITMKTKETLESKTCNKCGGKCKPSRGLVNYHHINKSYLRREKEFETKLLDCIKCVDCGHSFVPEKSTRELALKWWDNISHSEKGLYMEGEFKHRHPQSLTGREIEEIWEKETQTILEKPHDWKRAEYLTNKPNQKQFKEYNSELFKQYINKFSNEDKIKALLDICDIIGLKQLTSESYSFGNIEYKLPSDDKDYVTFHKSKDHPFICDKLMVCDINTTDKPIYKDWYMSINYHS